MEYKLQQTVLTPEDIQAMVQRVASEINAATADEELVVVGVMKGPIFGWLTFCGRWTVTM
ncbi:Uncharacterised protein [Weissella viridescens]|uniref:Hypoxanthine phosphoribosyltransferase n=1 Tax=Weissella viridescens TaxID=1629 RepID=A0A380P774_WEIVI|nr:Uncharacterised protein [Weissella viridescens]